ncbi:hypothetical protein JI735_34100 (plasmid) [Paenibacillus sonchi]|uniref:Uncharacterized protein n=1 Tax=Paenibacillus sonchi TaxID=373687 RepID=A0A974PI90_9BACL|nr:hypothetical protein [Paenibacillus sonchi]QQZ64474.1 hypothetical protein JI735_34100 [Paenibacillus sonchi]
MKQSLIPMLSTLEMFKNLTDHKLSENLVNRAKGQRNNTKSSSKNGSNDTIRNIEEAEELIDHALLENMIAVVEITDDGRVLQLTPEGQLTLAIYWTENFSDSYKVFAAEFESMMIENNQLLPPKLQVMKHYHTKVEITALKDFYTTRSTAQNLNSDFHQHVIREVAGLPALACDDYVFHFAPILFAPVDLRGCKVTLEIDGFNAVPELLVTSPYTNKRYYVSGLRNGRRNTAHGFYPIIAKKETFPLHKDIVLHWKIDNEIRIDHVLELDFNFGNPLGQLFSTQQLFTRSIAGTPSLSVITSLEMKKIHESQARVITHDIFNHFKIQQSVTLTNFPIELHHFIGASKYYSTWYSQWRGTEKE